MLEINIEDSIPEENVKVPVIWTVEQVQRECKSCSNLDCPYPMI